MVISHRCKYVEQIFPIAFRNVSIEDRWQISTFRYDASEYEARGVYMIQYHHDHHDITLCLVDIQLSSTI